MPTTSVRASRHSTLAFLAAAVLFTWALQLPAVLAKVGLVAGPVERFVPLAALGGFGPCVAALFFARFEPGGPGIRGLFRRLRIWRVGSGWYAIALGLLPLIYVIGVGLYRLAGGNAPWFFPPENAQHIAALLVVPLVEEIGWRGYALPRLQRHYSAIQASLIVGAAWSLYHVMMFVLQNVPATAFGLALANVLVASILFSWIYNHTRGSLLLAVLAHASAHLNNPAHAIPNLTPVAIQTSALIVLSGAVLAFDPRAWRQPYVEQQP